MQFIHLFLTLQGTKELFLMALITKEESHSNHKLFQPYCLANSIALKAPSSSALKALF